MKRIFSLIAAAAFAILPLAATTPADSDPADVKMETKTFAYSGFSELQVSWTYQVALTQADHYSVRVEAPDFVIPYLDVIVSGERLVLGIKEMPRDILKKVEMVLKHNEIRAWVAMPALSAVQMSGAANLNASGHFAARRMDFKLDLSGASALHGLSIEAADADIRCSGAAKFDVRGDFADLKIGLSGAAGGTLDAGKKVDEAELKLSGAVKFNLAGDFNELDLSTSGAVNFKMDGNVRNLDISGSGATKADLSGVPAERAEITLSGSARADIHVLNTLEVKLSGASTCRYKAGPDFRITEQTVSRGSSLKPL